MIQQVLDIISQHNKENPIFSAEIESLLGCSGGEIREYIKQLRRKRIPVVGGQGGYYMAKSIEEVREIFISLTHRALSMLQTRRQVRMLLKDMENQKKGQGELLKVER